FEGKEATANIVLIDFGCAKEVEDDRVYEDLVGTVYYLAPELASQKSEVPITGLVLKSADIWSIGVIAYVMLTGRPPFGGNSTEEIFQKIVNDPHFKKRSILFTINTYIFVFSKKKKTNINLCSDRLLFPDDIKLSDPFKDFAKKTLEKDPAKRIKLDEALQHPWVVGTDVSEVEIQKEVIHYLRQLNYQSKLKKAIARLRWFPLPLFQKTLFFFF
ncbi:hypothetical protein RFI_19801, partial [Reticulomyxa filosa]